MALRRLFRDRVDAGRKLAVALRDYRGEAPLIIGLPRGGVPVAYEVARDLGAPLDLWVVRKLGAPAQPELGLGAVAEGDETYVDEDIVAATDATAEEVADLIVARKAEVADRTRRFRRGGGPPDVRGRTVVVVDDGVATGGTARAALRAIRRREPRRLVFAVPVGSEDTLESLRDEADDVVCLAPRVDLVAIGLWYDDFAPTEDAEVIELLEHARRELAAARGDEGGEGDGRAVQIETADALLIGDLSLPRRARGLVLFAHGSGSSRRSPRNRFVAGALRRAGLGTLLFDLLTEGEDAADAAQRELRFDIDLLGRRLAAATDWVQARKETRGLAVGYFGASTGAAAALVAAAAAPDRVHAIVSRGGRPDLAEPVLADVRVPTLLIVGGEDREVLRLNRAALALLGGPKQLEVVAGATHLFEEPGALEQVAGLASAWFQRYLPESPRVAPGDRSAAVAHR